LFFFFTILYLWILFSLIFVSFLVSGRGADMEKLFSRKEAAKLLGVSLPTLDLARSTGLISYVQYVENGCVYFTEAGIQEYIARSTHRAKPRENVMTYRKRRV
jgi:hypothetical protein